MEKQAELANELLWQKRAIHHALCSILTESDAINALHAWVRKFSASGSAFGGLNQFAREVCDTHGLSGRHHELVRAMHRALVGNPNELRPLPEQQTEAVPEAQAEKPKVREIAILDIGIEAADATTAKTADAANRTPEFDCFKILLPNLMRAIEQHKPALVSASRDFLSNVVDNLPWSPAQQQQVLELLERGDTEQVRPYRPGQLKTLMSHLTVWLQEKLDKDTALLIIRQGIKESGTTIAGMAYSPKEFFSK